MNASVTMDEWGALIGLPDGRMLRSMPEDTPEYAARAAALGYNTPLEMCQEHDPMHVLLCAALDLETSPALVAAADKKPSTELTDAEEAMVLAAQRFLNLARKEGLV